MPIVQRVVLHEASGRWGLIVIQLRPTNPSWAWQALNAATPYDPAIGKMIIAINEDVDPEEMESVVWAMTFRMRPQFDVRTTPLASRRPWTHRKLPRAQGLASATFPCPRGLLPS